MTEAIKWESQSWNIKYLKEWDKNPRHMTKKGLQQLKASIERFGVAEPLVINTDGTLCGGHGRLKVLKKLKVKEVDCYIPNRELTPKEFEELNIRLNKNIAGEWDFEKLNNEWEASDLVEWGFDDIEFRTDDEEKEIIEDEVPDLPEKALTEPGEIWQLGEHRLMCGDSTKLKDVNRLMDGKKADMVFTDPPYNADYSSRVDAKRRKPWGGILNDKMSADKFDEFLLDINAVVFTVLKDGGAVYECIDWKRYPQMANIFGEAFTHKAMIVWNKNYFGLGTYYRTKHEIILFGCKGDKLGVWNGKHDEMDVWSLDRESTANYQHPTQKPVTIPARAINNSSNKGDLVIDLFLGSGSTLIAAEQTGRKCYGMELDPKYCDVIIERWENLTGNKAKLLKKGK